MSEFESCARIQQTIFWAALQHTDNQTFTEMDKQKSLGDSLAHGVAKREIREMQESQRRFRSFLLEEISVGKQSNTSIYNRVLRKLRRKYKKHILIEKVVGSGKKVTTHLDTIGMYQGVGIVLVCYTIPRIEPLENMQIEFPLVITMHCLARIYQTFSVRSFNEFIQKEKEIAYALIFLGAACKEAARVGIFSDKSAQYSFSAWHPKAEFKVEFEDGMAILKTVISVNAMAEVKARKGVEEAREEGGFRYLPNMFQAYKDYIEL